MRRYQQGSASSIMAIVILACLVLKIGAAVIPAFFDDRVIDSQIQEAVNASNNTTIPQKFYSDLNSRLSMNNVRDVKAEDIVKVTQTGKGIRAVKDYEVRSQFVLNVDFAMKFEKIFDKGTTE